MWTRIPYSARIGLPVRQYVMGAAEAARKPILPHGKIRTEKNGKNNRERYGIPNFHRFRKSLATSTSGTCGLPHKTIQTGKRQIDNRQGGITRTCTLEHTHAHTRCKAQPKFPSGVQLQRTYQMIQCISFQNSA